jgi:hypothetical protein
MLFLLITNFIVFGLTPPVLEPTIYRTRGKHPNHYVTDAVFKTYGTYPWSGKGFLERRKEVIPVIYFRIFYIDDVIPNSNSD